MTRRLVSSGGPWEASAGYSRAVVSGDTCWVSGTTDAGPDGRSRHPGAPGAQARAALDVIEHALGEAGFRLGDVVRTRMYVTDPADIPMVLEAHGERFGAVRPAATMVVVAALIEPSLLVEIEADAHRPGGASTGDPDRRSGRQPQPK
jgi:enamine deaminase RidA (YjgF/YER057c/UK114 family)